MEQELEAIMDTLADPVGTFYRFSMAHSLLHRARVNGNGDHSGTKLGEQKEISHETN